MERIKILVDQARTYAQLAYVMGQWNQGCYLKEAKKCLLWARTEKLEWDLDKTQEFKMVG